MAQFKYADKFQKNLGTKFDLTYAPGAEAPHPGIYECTNCGDEIAIAGGHKLPPQNHRQHSPLKGEIKWKLVAQAVQQ